jgi:hypothetical protein
MVVQAEDDRRRAPPANHWFGWRGAGLRCGCAAEPTYSAGKHGLREVLVWLQALLGALLGAGYTVALLGLVGGASTAAGRLGFTGQLVWGCVLGGVSGALLGRYCRFPVWLAGLFTGAAAAGVPWLISSAWHWEEELRTKQFTQGPGTFMVVGLFFSVVGGAIGMCFAAVFRRYTPPGRTWELPLAGVIVLAVSAVFWIVGGVIGAGFGVAVTAAVGVGIVAGLLVRLSRPRT